MDASITDFRHANRGLAECRGNFLNFDAVGIYVSTELSFTCQAAKLKVALDTPALQGHCDLSNVEVVHNILFIIVFNKKF